VLRFTYSIASLCEMAALFLTHVGNGGGLEEEFEVVKATYEKLMNVCPKCGRTLVRPGAECMSCRSKTKIIKKLAEYIMPYKGTLIFCMFLSLAGTAFHLVSPYATGLLVTKYFQIKMLRC